MNSTTRRILIVPALLAGCTAPLPTPAPPPPALPPPSVVAPPAVPPPLVPSTGPACSVSVLVGGEPGPAVPRDERAAIGHDAVEYLGSCRDRADRPADTLQWDAACAAPLCVRLVFAPPTELRGAGGPPVVAGEMLVPLGSPHLEGFVFVREGDGPHASFLAGDPALLTRLKQEAAGTLAIFAAAR